MNYKFILILYISHYIYYITIVINTYHSDVKCIYFICINCNWNITQVKCGWIFGLMPLNSPSTLKKEDNQWSMVIRWNYLITTSSWSNSNEITGLDGCGVHTGVWSESVKLMLSGWPEWKGQSGSVKVRKEMEQEVHGRGRRSYCLPPLVFYSCLLTHPSSHSSPPLLLSLFLCVFLHMLSSNPSIKLFHPALLHSSSTHRWPVWTLPILSALVHFQSSETHWH